MNLHVYYSELLSQDVTTTKHLYQALRLRTKDYSRNVKLWLEEFYGFKNKIRKPEEENDYSACVRSEKGRGNFAKNYEITIPFAKLITLNSRSPLKQQYAQWLLELERKKNNLELLTVDQVVFINKLIKFFKYVDNQKQVLKDHSKKYVEERTDKGKSINSLYGIFHNWRNSKLNITQEEVNERLKEYCLSNQRYIDTKKATKFDKMFTMDNYETLKHSVWDFMHVNNKENMAQKVSELVYKIAKEGEVKMKISNETNLFQEKEQLILGKGM